MNRHIALLIFTLFLAGCAATTPPPPRHLTSEWNPADVAWSAEKGTGSITGQAFFQTRGGQPRTCAGLEVSLIPQSPYADERIEAIYGDTVKGYRPAWRGRIHFAPDHTTYHDTMIEAVCDAQGNFSFEDLPAGTYYVITRLTWQVDYSVQGGSLMQRVELNEGETKRVILTP
jgi:hypothetical protein